MKRKFNLMMPAALAFSVFAFLISGAGIAQQLQTAATQQPKVFGQWQPPNSRNGATAPDPTRDQFRQLFPSDSNRRAPFQLTDQQPANNYPLPQQPAPLVNEPTNARPLKPSGAGNFLQGTFLQPAKPGGEFARVNHHEVQTAAATLPLPNPDRLTAWPSAAPQLDRTASLGPESSITSVVDSMQSSGKELWGQLKSEGGGWSQKITSFFSGGDGGRFKKVFGSLALVVGGYLAFVLLMRKFNFTGNHGIPSEVIEVIGNAPFGPRKNLQLVRLGSKLLLLMNSPEGTHPVGEITDPQEVEYLISLCNGKGTKANRSIRSVVNQLSGSTASAAPFVSRLNERSGRNEERSGRNERSNRNPERSSGRTLHPTNPFPTETTFSTNQLVQALESIRNTNRPGTVFEA